LYPRSLASKADLPHRLRAKHALEAREDHGRGTHDGRRPLRRLRLHQKDAVLEAHRADASHGCADCRAPGEVNLARRERRLPHHLREGAWPHLAKRLHRHAAGSYHCSMRLVLASASPRRAELLTNAGFTFSVRTTEVDERVLPGEHPRDYVRRLAAEKARCALERIDAAEPGLGAVGGPDAIVAIGADTAVIVDEEIFGKPADDDDAARMLHRLSGRAHVVMTGVSLRARGAEVETVEATEVFLAPLTDEQIAWYVASGEGRDKAGAYAIQGLASRFIPKIVGSYSNVVGLPVAQVSHLISEISERLRVLASGR